MSIPGYCIPRKIKLLKLSVSPISTPKHLFWGREYPVGIFKTNAQNTENLYFTRMNISGSKTNRNNKLTNLTINIINIKTCTFSNYCIDSNKILHNDKDHHRWRCKFASNNSKMATATIMKKKLRCLHTRSTDFDKILPFDAHWPPTAEHVKISNFWKSKMMAAAMKNCSISQPHMTTHTLI